jgi:hypothetical protein
MIMVKKMVTIVLNQHSPMRVVLLNGRLHQLASFFLEDGDCAVVSTVIAQFLRQYGEQFGTDPSNLLALSSNMVTLLFLTSDWRLAGLKFPHFFAGK